MDSVTAAMGKSGFILFTIGLLIGAAVQTFRNPRMGLSAHLTAVQTGPALIAFALFWRYFSVPPSWAWVLQLSLVGSAFLLTAGLMASAMTGASQILPIAGKGFSASEAQERVVKAMVLGSSVWMLVACLTICACFLFG